MNAISDVAYSLRDELDFLIKNLISTIGDQPVPGSVGDGISAFRRECEAQLHFTDDQKRFHDSLRNMALYARAITQGVLGAPNLSEEAKSIAKSARDVSSKIGKFLASDPLTYRSLAESAPTNEMSAATEAKNSARTEAADRAFRDLQGRMKQAEISISTLQDVARKVEAQAQGELIKLAATYDAVVTEIDQKRNQINDILGHVAGRAIAGDYEKSAADEKRVADRLRNASLACMVLIAAVLGYSFWETTHGDFDWQKSLFRVALAFLLSAPAAYLARESAKHRLQQYSHLQTSLDLKAISPYLASLPEETQHQIKSEIAKRIFAGKDFAQMSTDSYPINAQELLMEFIKKLDFPKGAASRKE